MKPAHHRSQTVASSAPESDAVRADEENDMFAVSRKRPLHLTPFPPPPTTSCSHRSRDGVQGRGGRVQGIL